LGILDFLKSIFLSSKGSNGAEPDKGKVACQSQPASSRPERGTVTYKKDLGTIEAGGVGLNTSIVVKKYTEQEIRESAKEDKWFFEPAFWNVAEEVEADRSALEGLLAELIVAHASGSPRREQETVMKYLPEGAWRWAAFENFIFERDKEAYEEEIDEIKNAPLCEMLNWLKVPELREIYKDHVAAKSGPIGKKKKADIIKTICADIDPQMSDQIVESLRNRFLSEVEKPETVNYREMCNMFARRVSMFAYSIQRRKQMLEMTDWRPIWKFKAGFSPETPERCKKLDGKTFKFDDPFWKTGFPPCGRMECDCSVEVKLK
jgi:hypothetical protein